VDRGPRVFLAPVAFDCYPESVDARRALPAQTERALAEAARAWPAVELLMLFGSAAAERMTDASDVDLLVRLSPGSSPAPDERERFVQMASRACGREVDLVIEQPATSVILRRQVAEKGRTLFERTPGAARRFVVEANLAYIDLEPYLRRIGAVVRERAIREGSEARARLAHRGSADGG
jgi:predicted nucleotidyltransferase